MLYHRKRRLTGAGPLEMSVNDVARDIDRELAMEVEHA